MTKLGNSRFTEEITSPNLGRSHNLPHLDTKMTTLEGIAQRKMMSVHGYDTTYPSKGVSLFGKVPLLTFVNAISEKKHVRYMFPPPDVFPVVELAAQMIPAKVPH